MGVCLFLGLPLLVFAFVLLIPIRDSFESNGRWQVEQAARSAVDVVREELEGISGHARDRRMCSMLIEASRTKDADLATEALRELVRSKIGIDRAFLTDPQGVLWADFPADANVLGQSFAHRDWYAGVRQQGDVYVSAAYLRAASPLRTVVAVAVPVQEEVDTLAYLVVQVGVPWLASQLASRVQLGSGDLRVFDHLDGLVMGMRDGSAVEPSGGGLPDRAAEGRSRPADPDDSPITVAFPVEPFGWSVVAHRPLDPLLAPWRALRNWTLALVLCFFIVTGGLGFMWLESLRRRQEVVRALHDQKYLMSHLVVHDLRTPLTSISLSLEMADASIGDHAALRSDLERARRATEQLRHLTDVLLDVIRMEDGEFSPRFAEHDVREIVTDRAEAFAPISEARSIEIVLVLPSGPVGSLVDRDLLGRVLDNLLSNAGKHTPAGGRVTVVLWSERSEVHLAVRDSGMGIAAEDLPGLFQKYARVGRAEGSTPAGLGLGLLFCRLVLELHGGRMEVASEPGRGTEFRAVLPAVRAAAAAEGRPAV